ncbi:PstS family phosphate ABC transporter substrate-binding protein [Sphaerisporangium aureirubrum]|uniref:PstS family phosphate ABC transporter substrate-binding protein n=1 Tax=Sphaerisporangium aureirubrum TaxID=1544736 RepID=A0ABW1NP28_9ACTN
MAVLEWLARLVNFLGGAGPVLFSIALLIATPYFDRLLVRRKRLGFRVLYNSKIGLGPETLHDGAEPARSGPPQLRQVMRLLDRMSMVVIRIRNSGSYDIGPEDFDRPLSFTFGGRVVWNARVSDASTPELRARLRESLRFFSTEENPPPRDNLLTVRQRLSERMTRWLGAPSGQEVAEPHWHGVRIDGLTLRPGQKAKLVVVLREAGNGSSGDDVTKVVEHAGKLRDTGLIKDERLRRRITLPRVSGALAGLLTVVLLLSLVSDPPDGSVACAAGTLRIEGSTVFLPAVEAIRDEYVKACGDGARITVEANGSLDGVRGVVESTPGEELIAFSDGTSQFHDRLYHQKIAIVVFYVVVNSGVGLTTLSVADLRKIYDGTWTDWNQVPGASARSLPIRIVGRGEDSGTRKLFEQQVLGTPEGPLSSDLCLEKDRAPDAPVIRCQRDQNSEIVRKITEVPGAIGYSDAQSLIEARRANQVTALTLDGRAFDTSTAVDSGYPFWTVEYLYTKSDPTPGTLTATFLNFTLHHPQSRSHLTESGFRPCTTPDSPLQLCTLR